MQINVSYITANDIMKILGAITDVCLNSSLA